MAPPNKDWWKLAAVAAVGVVLAGLGTVIASNFAPPSTLAGPVAAPAVTTTEALITTTTQSLFVAPVAAASATTLAAEPAVLEVAESILDFGEGDTSVNFDLTNSGEGDGSWSIASSDPNVTTDPSDGQISPGEVVAVSATFDRTTAAEGELAAVLALATGAVDYFIHPGQFGAAATEAIVTGVAAGGLSLTVSFVRRRFKRRAAASG